MKGYHKVRNGERFHHFKNAKARATEMAEELGKICYVYGYADAGDIRRYLVTDAYDSKHLVYFSTDEAERLAELQEPEDKGKELSQVTWHCDNCNLDVEGFECPGCLDLIF